MSDNFCAGTKIVPDWVSGRTHKHGDFVAKLCRAARISKVDSYFLDKFFILQMVFTVASPNCKVKMARFYEFLFTLG